MLEAVQIAHPTDAVPPAGYGGIGRVVHAIHRTLTFITTVCPPGSSGNRIVLGEAATTEALLAVSRKLPPADVYLVHSGEMAAAASEAFGADRVHEMLHMPVSDVQEVADSPWNLIGISASQLADLWPLRPEVRYAWHGTEVRPVGAGEGGYLVWVGRFAPEKGPLDAVTVAERAGVPLKLAGRATNKEEQAYFDALVAPRLGRQVEYVGEVTTSERDALVGAAAASLVPTRWREPFGLTAIESAMLGTPVLGYPAGATAELLRSGIGEICYGMQDMADRAVEVLQKGSRRPEVAAAARENFSIEAQAARLELLLRSR